MTESRPLLHPDAQPDVLLARRRPAPRLRGRLGCWSPKSTSFDLLRGRRTVAALERFGLTVIAARRLLRLRHLVGLARAPIRRDLRGLERGGALLGPAQRPLGRPALVRPDRRRALLPSSRCAPSPVPAVAVVVNPAIVDPVEAVAATPVDHPEPVGVVRRRGAAATGSCRVNRATSNASTGPRFHSPTQSPMKLAASPVPDEIIRPRYSSDQSW